ncbi:MAG TPA: S9 family peptidase [Gemmatimonadales bacterium]|nr:S9 family peptidase [Gemmatimonadales bacterium]
MIIDSSSPGRALRALAVALVVLPAAAAGQQAAPGAVPRYPIEDFFHTTAYAGASFSADGTRLLVSSNQTGVWNIYEISVAGGEPKALSSSTTDAVRGIGFFPADDRVLFGRDQGGNELTHIYVRERDGTTKDLTPGEGHRAQFAGWARDGRSFFVQANERDRRFFDVYEYAVDGYARTMLYRNDQGFVPLAVSPDRRYVGLVKSITNNDSDVYLHDRTTGATKNLTAHTGRVSNGVEDFSADGASLYLTTDEGREFAYLVRLELATGRREVVAQPAWDVMGAGISRGGRHLTLSINNDARTEIQVFELPGMRRVALPEVPGANLTGVAFSSDDGQIAFYASASRQPSDLYTMRIGDAAPRRLTRSLNPKLAAEHLVDGKVARFRSYDGLEIPGILYLPHGATASSRAPGIVLVHGGPGGQARLGWNPLVQYLVNGGYAVFDINNRGSSGYGKTFFALDDRKHGEADLGDVVAAKTLLASTGVVDTTRVAVMGGSYGGYMTLAALTLAPDAFTAGVDIFGPANWIRTIRSVPPWWTAQKDALYAEMGDPHTDTLRLQRVSPLFHADRIRRPLIVLQGANDPRVLQRESDDIVAAVRKNGVPVEYIVFPDEGHGFSKRENQLRGYRAVRDFLDRYVAKAPGTT